MKEWFLGLEPRERRILVVGGALAVLGLLFGLVVEPLYSSVAARQESVRQNTATLARMRQIAASAPARTGGPARRQVTSFVVEFDRQIRRAGLSPYLEETRPNGSDGVRARFENVPFDRLMETIHELDARIGLRVVNASVERGDVAGTINARITLTSS